jgi:hypothetical protein
MDKSNLLKALDENGLFAEYDDLYRDDVDVRDWVSRNEDLVRSNRAIAQAVQADAPHDVKSGYFKDKEEKRQYEAGEKKYNEESAKKQQLADEYQRAKDIEDFSQFSLPRTTNDMTLKDRAKAAAKYLNDNLIALGFNLTPQAAKNVYIKEGYKPGKIGAQAGIGTVANVLELAPGTGPVGKAVNTFAAPVIRAGQDIYEGKDLSEVGGNFAFDTGLNSMLTYMPVKEVWNYGKRVLGQGGKAGEKVLQGKVDEILEQADMLENKDEVLKNLSEQETKLNQYQKAYSEASDLDRAKLIKDVENTHPELAKAIEAHANAIGEKRFVHSMAGSDKAKDINVDAVKQQAYEFYAAQFGPNQAKEIVDKMAPVDCINFLKRRTTDIANETAEDVGTAFTNAKMINFEKQAALNDELFDKAGNLKIGVENLSDAAAYALPNKLSKVIATVAPTARGVARNVVTPSRKSVAPEDKEYDSAIEYIIQSNKRQWNAGFKPRGGIELEAWQIAKDRGEI